jgi:hypothetical protein
MFEVFMAVALKNVVIWDVLQCDCCKNDVSEERISFIRVERISKMFLYTLFMFSVASYC